MTDTEILSLIAERYGPPEWQFVHELRCGTSYGRREFEGRLDAWAISAYQSHAWRRIAFEIKVSKADYAAELRQPIKRRAGLLLSNLFYFVAPRGIVDPAKLPIECGLMEISQAQIGPVLQTTVPAPWRDTPPPPWCFVASLVRQLARKANDD